ncbi:unnamed protein product [Somion occarium]|uniref:DNA polymerase V n=1 Tax=Somion occarium TaxID=3059160 RepID=A0ABP1D9C0_9APHY
MSTTLELFWHLSSANKKDRLDASAKLIGALERFQAEFVPKEAPETSDEDENEEFSGKNRDGLDALNAQDVSYSIRRLVRGLASPRESSRLGFAVALTELLSRINTVTCSQAVTLILDSSKTQGSMTGQEERDVLFARLFGLTAVIQSGLIVRDTPLSSSASSATEASNLASFSEVISELLALGEKRSWLRESAWWTIGLAVDALGASSVYWKDDAFEAALEMIYVENKIWTPEKIALTLKLQKLRADADWRKLLSPPFKQPEITHSGNYTALARILKEVNADEDEDADVKSKTVSWKPQVHYVWDLLLGEVLSPQSSKGSFPEMFRILVDESLFSSTSSPERKYWGFQIFQKALSRVSATDLPMLFTKNFMRSWINHLSNSDRYLHKAAKQVVTDIQGLVKKDPTLGFALILQLTGVHGSHQFDKLTKTKTVETILTSMDNEGIQSYIKYLLGQVNDQEGGKTADIQAINARRAWVIEQLAALVRNGAVPKDDAWVQAVLDWFTVHGLFIVRKQSEKSEFLALHSIPAPPFSDELRKLCRERLLSCLAELTTHASVVQTDDKNIKVSAVASDGQFWVSKVLSTIERLDKDTKHVRRIVEAEEEEEELRQKARELASRLSKITGEQQEAAKGAELLVSATLLHHYCATDDEDSDSEALQSCVDGASGMFPVETKKTKKSRKSVTTSADEVAPEPIDLLVDTVIGSLEEATAYMRAVANQVFTLLSGSVKESTIDLIVAQLSRRDPAELLQDEDEDMEDSPDADSEDQEDSESESSHDEEDDEEDMEEDPELRRKIEEALRVNGINAATGESDDESDEEFMDDDQMMAIDEQLAAVFKARADEKRNSGVDAQREATHYKNRVLDLVDIFLKKQPTSPHVIRVILPLVELIVDTSSDEKQLADKTTGILRSRIGKSKEIPADVDKEQAIVVLQELHVRARKAPSSDVLATLNQCSLYLVKTLLNRGDAEQEVVKAYQESLKDFITRKASRLNTAFLQDFIRRYPGAAWNLRNNLIDVTKTAVNGYRQSQAFQLLQVLVNQLFAIGDHKEEIISFMPSLRDAILAAVSKACTEASLTAAHVKEILKLAISAVRQSKRIVSSPEELATLWDPSSWEELSKNLATSDSLKAAAGLQNLCKQVIRAVNQSSTKDSTSSNKPSSGATKRKADDGEQGDEEVVTKKAKRKKVNKNKSS